MMHALSMWILLLAPVAAGKTVRYTCPGGETFAALYEAKRVVLTMPGKPRLALPQQPAASGARYSDGYTVFSTKGSEAAIEAGTITLKGCTDAGAPAAPLTGKWRLVELGGKAVPKLPRPPDIEFQPEGRAAGSAGCNRFSTEYKAAGKTLKFGMIAATKMACLAEGAMEWEDRYLDALQKTAGFARSGDELVLLGMEGEVLGRLRDAAAVSAVPSR